MLNFNGLDEMLDVDTLRKTLESRNLVKDNTYQLGISVGLP
jgi:hypothetical protein